MYQRQLLTYVSDTLDGFRPTSNSFSTEQGFRGLIAALRYGETGLPFRLFDFSDRAMETAEATWAQHGPVTFAAVSYTHLDVYKRQGIW